MYLTCLHCEKKFNPPSKRRYCSVLCRSAMSKRVAQQKLADDRYHERVSTNPTFDLTDLECLRIEARLDAQEQHVFESKRGFSIKDGHQETSIANANELHEPWANKGASLDVWEIRRKDRERFGGIVVTDGLAAVMTDVLGDLADTEATRTPVDGLDSTSFHLKVFPDELDKAEKRYLESSGLPYDRDLLKAS